MPSQSGKERLGEHFADNAAIYWANLARLANLLVVLNISLFFVSGLVVEQGYFYTYFSLGCMLPVFVMLVVPLGLTRRLGGYLVCLALMALAVYFFVASLVYWVRSGGVEMLMKV